MHLRIQSGFIKVLLASIALSSFSCNHQFKIEQSESMDSMVMFKFIFTSSLMKGTGGRILLVNKETLDREEVLLNIESADGIIGTSKGFNPYIIISKINPGVYKVYDMEFNDAYNGTHVPSEFFNEITIEPNKVYFLGSYKSSIIRGKEYQFEIIKKQDVSEEQIRHILKKSSTYSKCEIINSPLFERDTLTFEGRFERFNKMRKKINHSSPS